MKFRFPKQKTEFNKYKQYYFVFIFLVYLYLAWAYLGTANPLSKQNTEFYVWFGFIGLFFLILDVLTQKSFPVIDSVTIESDTPSYAPPKLQIILSIIITIATIYIITQTNSAFVSYPKLQIFDTPILNAISSGLKGFIENLVIFNVGFPTLMMVVPGIYRFITKKDIGRFNTFLISSMITAFVFMIFHIFVYGHDINALLMVVIFSYMVMIPQYFLRTSLIGDTLHITNNIVAYLIQAKVGFMII